MKNRNFLFIYILLVFPSCNDFLKEDPKGFVAPSQYFNTEAEIEAAIYGAYDYLNLDRIGEYEWVLLGDLGTDISRTRVVARWNYQFADMETIPAEYTDMWREYYAAIGAANSVIERVQANNQVSEDFSKRIVAEAKFLRAFNYFHLSLIWGNVPIWLNELNDLVSIESTPTSLVTEVREYVISDLIDAIDDLPPTVSETGRVTSWAAKSLLSRVYLFDHQWEKARNMAKDVIDNSGHALSPTFASLFDWKNKNNSELIHIVPKIADIKQSLLHSFSSPRPFDDGNAIVIPDGEMMIRPDGHTTIDKSSRNPGGMFQGWGVFHCTKEHYETYAPGDSRKELWWHEIKFTDGSTYVMQGGSSAGVPGNSGYYNLKWVAWDEGPNNGGRDTHLQRLGELYLIYAEAENELNGPTASAYDAINSIRRRAFGNSDNDLSGLSKDEFRQAVIKENAWELGGEGLRRWYLWHWGYDTYLKAAQSVSLSNPILAQNLKPHHLYFRIPDTEIAKNPNLLQNSGYQ